MDMTALQTFLSTTAIEVVIKLLAAIAFWVVGRWLIAKVIRVIQAVMGRNHLDTTLTKYLGSVINVLLGPRCGADFPCRRPCRVDPIARRLGAEPAGLQRHAVVPAEL